MLFFLLGVGSLRKPNQKGFPKQSHTLVYKLVFPSNRHIFLCEARIQKGAKHSHLGLRDGFRFCISLAVNPPCAQVLPTFPQSSAYQSEQLSPLPKRFGRLLLANHYGRIYGWVPHERLHEHAHEAKVTVRKPVE